MGRVMNYDGWEEALKREAPQYDWHIGRGYFGAEIAVQDADGVWCSLDYAWDELDVVDVVQGMGRMLRRERVIPETVFCPFCGEHTAQYVSGEWRCPCGEAFVLF